ncbi:hypothetical protein SAMN05216327_102289 [Dyadobacter sp. SG02]|nr:hypothetical protein SAMN05216327_102289 [Dyadobacter sp. SG02]
MKTIPLPAPFFQILHALARLIGLLIHDRPVIIYINGSTK